MDWTYGIAYEYFYKCLIKGSSLSSIPIRYVDVDYIYITSNVDVRTLLTNFEKSFKVS